MTAVDGETFEPKLDAERLETLFDRVLDLMEDGAWRTYAEIKRVTGGSEGGIGARLRDLRKPQHGRRTVARRRRDDPEAGAWEYRLEPVPPFEFDAKKGQGHFLKALGVGA